MEVDSSSSFGQRLRSCRRYRGMSSQVLAGLTGLSKSYLSMVENGHRTLDTRRRIALLADALKVSVADLTGGPVLPPSRQAGAHMRR